MTDDPSSINGNLMWSMGLLGAIGGMAIKAISDIVVAIIRKRRGKDEPDISEQISTLLQDSEKYRKEVKSDLDAMRLQMNQMKNDHAQEIVSLRETYELELNVMKLKMRDLVKLVEQYRLENESLRAVLHNKGIDLPEWIKKTSEQ